MNGGRAADQSNAIIVTEGSQVVVQQSPEMLRVQEANINLNATTDL